MALSTPNSYAVEQLGTKVSLIAAQDMDADRWYPVKITADSTVDYCAAGEACVGIAQEGAPAGEGVRICVTGISFVQAGVAGIAAGDILYADGNKGVTNVDPGTGIPVGIAVFSSVSDSTVIGMLVHPQWSV